MSFFVVTLLSSLIRFLVSSLGCSNIPSRVSLWVLLVISIFAWFSHNFPRKFPRLFGFLEAEHTRERVRWQPPSLGVARFSSKIWQKLCHKVQLVTVLYATLTKKCSFRIPSISHSYLRLPTLFVSTDAIFTLRLNRFKTYLLARRDCNNFLDLQLKQAAINISRPSALHTNRHAPIKGPKRLSKYGEKRSTVSAKGNKLEGFSQNGCKPGTPFWGFDSIDANSTCSFTKQDLTFKQAHIASFCFVLGNQPKFWQLTLDFSAFTGNSLILHQTQWTVTTFLVLRGRY